MAETATDTKAKATKDTEAEATPTQEWEGTFTDLSNIQRRFKITESDGTTIDVTIKWPGKTTAENIEGYLWTRTDKGMRQTLGDYHEALFTLFGKPVVNGTTSKQTINEAFFDKHEDKTYDYLMEKADSFLARTPETAE